ncbi:uncharacterized protein zgc:66455 [Anoplopoma fimbria]|uniref:uncharacterized protein zgc:66455 n=1 Tax=Anoplopoma fimbria TaxID=229290 RepID=UPI0023EC966B|nr:uncharacterized protein zgc:66455 [Anoplopoma fimbria]
MPQQNSFSLKSVPLIFLLIFGIFWKHCDSQVNREDEANKPPDGPGGDGGAFFAMRSCHRLLHGDTGEFFSPDYLCSNPPLWCNWTIQVDPAKRIHLHLEDLSSDDGCFLKEDQVHVDEPPGGFRGHKILQKCWREAKYTSSSNTLYVVVLIGGWPSPPYRGFYGRYQAFGPPVVYNPHEGFLETNRKSEPSPGLMDFNELVMDGEQMDLDLPELPSTGNTDFVYDYYGQYSGTAAELDHKDANTKIDENQPLELEFYNHIYPSKPAPTEAASTLGTSRSGRGAAPTPSDQSDSADPPASPQQQHGGQDQEPQPTTSSPITIQVDVEEDSTHPQEAAVPEEENPSDGENRTEVWEGPVPSEAPEPEDTEQTHPHPNMVEPLSDHRGNLNIRNHSEIPHLPGDHLFEVALEVNFRPDSEESWDILSGSLLLSVKTLISEQLKSLHTPLSMSTKRIKRLSTGVLYILWLQIAQQPGGLQVHKVVHSGLQGLIGTGIEVSEHHGKAVLISVSIADVNECGTQLVLCDVNADCLNQFGSYSCRCRPGFQDKSRLGSGGTVCADAKAAGCTSGLSAETKGVYVLFFLLSFLILVLLAAAGLLYHRHRRGAFLVRCHSSDSVSLPDNNNHHHHHGDSDLPPTPTCQGPQGGLASGEGALPGHRPAAAELQPAAAAAGRLHGVKGRREEVTIR